MDRRVPERVAMVVAGGRHCLQFRFIFPFPHFILDFFRNATVQLL